MKTRYEKEIRNLERELSKSKGGDKEFCKEILFSIQLVTGLPEYYDSSDLICRQQIIGSIFLEKMIFQDGELRIKKVNSAVELICSPLKDFLRNKNKKSSENSELSNLVPHIGMFSNQLREDIRSYTVSKTLLGEDVVARIHNGIYAFRNHR